MTISPLVMLIPAVFFWCICKREGVFLLFGYGMGNLAKDLIKLTACVYRPWIRDPSVNSLLKASATGYSFPSGHTTSAVVLYGGIGVYLRQYRKWLFWVMVIPVLLVAFARNWLGCHTPQDVIVALLVTTAVMVCVWYLLEWIEKNPTKDLLVAGIGLLICVASLVYIVVKPYPIDFAADGSILVAPEKMMPGGFGTIGFCIGMFIGWIIERRLIKFSLDVSVAERVVRGLIGFTVGYLMMTYLQAPVVALCGALWGKFATYLIYALYIFVLVPLVIKAWDVLRRNRLADCHI